MGKCRPGASRKVLLSPKQSQAFPGRNYFITMYHQAGVNFENFTEVKFWDILLTGTGHRDRRLNPDSPGQTGMCGRSNLSPNLNLNLTSGSLVKDHLLFLLFSKRAAPLKSAANGHCPPRPPSCRGPGHWSETLTSLYIFWRCVCALMVWEIYKTDKSSHVCAGSTQQ